VVEETALLSEPCMGDDIPVKCDIGNRSEIGWFAKFLVGMGKAGSDGIDRSGAGSSEEADSSEYDYKSG